MANKVCIIDVLRSTIEHEAVLKFTKKKVNVKTVEAITIPEESHDARLKELTISARSTELKDGNLENGIFINLDHKAGNLSCFTHFVKQKATGVRQKCDFAFVYKSRKNIYIAISELKSSHQGINDRCHGQFSNSELFIDYIINILKNTIAKLNCYDVHYQKIIFMPAQKSAVSMVETTVPKTPRKYSRRADYFIFEVEVDEHGKATIPAKDIITSLPQPRHINTERLRATRNSRTSKALKQNMGS